MAVAVKPSSEAMQQGRLINTHLAVSSLLGALYLLFAVWMVFTGLSILWIDVLEMDKILSVTRQGIQGEPYLSRALLLLVHLAAVASFLLVGRVLEGPRPRRGLRAGSVLSAIALFAIFLITLGLGNLLSTRDAWIMMSVPAIAGAGLVYGWVWFLCRPSSIQWLGHLEDQGWFRTTPYKANQGARVRLGTVLALLVLVLCGCYTMIDHKPFGVGQLGIDLAWSDNQYVPILLNVRYTVPLIFLLVCGWLSWRVVHWTAFADFLIATEAEMNKVSWTTRKRLLQDTVVVLVTVFLLTVFLFVVDIVWVKVLSAPWIRVLQIDPIQESAKRNESTQW